jgi:hypothetical protein
MLPPLVVETRTAELASLAPVSSVHAAMAVGNSTKSILPSSAMRVERLFCWKPLTGAQETQVSDLKVLMDGGFSF